MNISVKKFSKKSLSLLIALIMVFSALPLTPPISADAAEFKTNIDVWDASRAGTNSNRGQYRYSYADSQTHKTLSGIQWDGLTHNSTYLTVNNSALSFAEISSAGAITENDNDGITDRGIRGNKWSFSAKFAYTGSSTKTTVFGLSSTTKRNYTQSNTNGDTVISNGYVADLVDIRADGTVYINNTWSSTVSGIASADLVATSATAPKTLTVTYDNGNLTIDIDGTQKISQTVDTALFSAGVGNYLAGPNVQVFSGGTAPYYQVTNNGAYLRNFNLYSLSGATYVQEGSQPTPPTNKTVSVVGYGAVKKSGNDRASGTTITIVNDQQDDNFGIGFVNFDISSLSNTEFNVGSANYNMTYSIDSSGREAMGLSFYYATKNDTVFNSTVKGGNLTDTGISSNVYGTGNQHIAKAKTYLGLQKIADVSTHTNATNEQFSVDISPAIRYALSKGKTNCQLLIMLTTAGGEGKYNSSGQSDYWSDTPVTVNTSSVPVTLQTDADYVRDHISSANKTYTNIYVNNADSNFMSGVISGSPFADTTAITINDYDSSSNNSVSLKIFGMPNAVAIYTGTSSDIRFPVIFQNSGYGNASNVRTYMSVDHISLSSGNFAMSGNNWDRCSSWNDLTNNSESTFNFYSTRGGNFEREDANSTNKFLTSEQKTWRNYIKYTGSVNTTDYYEKLTSATFNFQADFTLNWRKNSWASWSNWGQGAKGPNYNKDLTYPLGLYVLNYKPLNDIVIPQAFIDNCNEISQNSWKYTQAGLDNYYSVVADIIDFNLAHESMTSETEVAAVANKIKGLVTRYDKYKSPERKKLTLTFNRNDGTNATMEITAGDSVGTLPANSSATHIDGTNTHNGYVWDGVTTASVPQSDNTYSETPAVLNCSGGTATCTQKAICSSCNTEYGSLAKHSFETDFPTPGKVKAPEGYNNGYTYQGCANCDAEDPSRVEYRVYDDQSSYWDTYRALLAQANDKIAENEATNGAKYTLASINELKTTIARVKKVDDETKSKLYIENENKKLQEAINAVLLNQYSITLKYVDEKGADLGTSTIPDINYGTIEDVTANTTFNNKSYVVYKWTRLTQEGDILSGLNSTSVSVNVVGDLTYFVHLKSTQAESPENTAVVTLNNKAGKPVDVGYVTTNEPQDVVVKDNTIKIGTTTTLTAPQYSFYSVKGFIVNKELITAESGKKSITVTENMTIIPLYSPTSRVDITRRDGEIFTINGKDTKSYSARWDELITLETTGEVIWCTTTKNNKEVVLGKGSIFKFRANEKIEIYTKQEDASLTPNSRVGYFGYDADLKKVTIVNNFFVPGGANASVKAGVVVSTKEKTKEEMIEQYNAGTLKFQGGYDKFTADKNQIRITINRNGSGDFSMWALSYVIVNGTPYFADDVISYTYNSQSTTA